MENVDTSRDRTKRGNFNKDSLCLKLHDARLLLGNQFRSEMSMAVRPLPPPLPRRYRRGGGGAVAVDIFNNHRGSGAVAVVFLNNHRGSGAIAVFLEIDAKIHEFGHKLNVLKCKL